jgi:hypothetical protein
VSGRPCAPHRRCAPFQHTTAFTGDEPARLHGTVRGLGRSSVFSPVSPNAESHRRCHDNMIACLVPRVIGCRPRSRVGSRRWLDAVFYFFFSDQVPLMYRLVPARIVTSPSTASFVVMRPVQDSVKWYSSSIGFRVLLRRDILTSRWLLAELSVCIFSIIDGQHEHNPFCLVQRIEDSIRPRSVSPCGGSVTL